MTPSVAYIDVDDTLVRTAGTKRMPIPNTVAYVRALASSGCKLYCWSSGGAEYAKVVAIELGIDKCFLGFLPKPELIVDDMDPSRWLNAKILHPAQLPQV